MPRGTLFMLVVELLKFQGSNLSIYKSMRCCISKIFSVRQFMLSCTRVDADANYRLPAKPMKGSAPGQDGAGAAR